MRFYAGIGGYGYALQAGGFRLPFSGECLVLYVDPLDYGEGNLCDRYCGPSYGGVAGLTGAQTDWMPISPEHMPLFKTLAGRDVRFQFYDVALISGMVDVEIWIYNPDGLHTVLPRRRVRCWGYQLAGVDFNGNLRYVTRHSVPRPGSGSSHATMGPGRLHPRH
jgi:hypothetical protein